MSSAASPRPQPTWKTHVLKRVLGLAMIADGLAYLVAGKSFGLNLKTAFRIARTYRRHA